MTQTLSDPTTTNVGRVIRLDPREWQGFQSQQPEGPATQGNIDDIVDAHMSNAPRYAQEVYAKILREAEYDKHDLHRRLYGTNAEQNRKTLAAIVEQSSAKYAADLKKGILKAGWRSGTTLVTAASDIGEYFAKWGSNSGYLTRAIKAFGDVGYDLYKRVKYSTGMWDLVKNMTMGALYATGRLGVAYLSYANPVIPGLGWTPIGALADEAAAQILNRTIGIRALAAKKAKYDAIKAFDQAVPEDESWQLEHKVHDPQPRHPEYIGLRPVRGGIGAIRTPQYALGDPQLN